MLSQVESAKKESRRMKPTSSFLRIANFKETGDSHQGLFSFTSLELIVEYATYRHVYCITYILKIPHSYVHYIYAPNKYIPLFTV